MGGSFQLHAPRPRPATDTTVATCRCTWQLAAVGLALASPRVTQCGSPPVGLALASPRVTQCGSATAGVGGRRCALGTAGRKVTTSAQASCSSVILQPAGLIQAATQDARAQPRQPRTTAPADYRQRASGSVNYSCRPTGGCLVARVPHPRSLSRGSQLPRRNAFLDLTFLQSVE